jgi:tetratricopeptide (TPR) repeat protein
MKKTIALFLVGCSFFAGAQNIQVQNMINYLRNKDFAKAKVAADLAAEHESTKTSAKMWMSRGNVYKAIYADTSKAVRDIDMEAEEKALESFVTCLKLDKDNIYKDDVKGSVVQSAAATNRKANYYASLKEFEKANHCYDLLETALPFDFDQGMKRQNITKEKILFNRFEMFKNSGNKEKTKEYANKLIEIKYKEPKIYTDMVRLSLLDKDTAGALNYIEKGKLLFEDNMTLIGTEIDIYLARKRTNELKDKLKAAIDVAPDNELLYVVLGQICEKSNDYVGAEQAYLKAVELKPELEIVNFKLGAMYFNQAAEINKKLNDLPPKETEKAKEYQEQIMASFKKAAPYLEKAYEITPDKAYKQRLFQIYARLGESEKAAKYK